MLLATAAAYANSFAGGFVLDARALVLLNPSVQAATWENVRALLAQDYWHPFGAGGLYRPATTLSYLFNYAVLRNGDDAFGYHALNLALHLGCTTLVYVLALEVVRRPWTAVAAAALFGLHPIATEAVTNIAGRADLLAAFGTLTALALHAAGGGRLGVPIAAGAAALLAFSAKESALVLPAAMLAHDAIVGARPGARARYAAVLLALAAYAAARFGLAQADPLVLASVTPPLDNPLVEVHPLAARLTALTVAARELALLAWPARLSADYSCCAIPVVAVPPSGRDALRLGAIVLAFAALAAGLLRQRRTHPGRCFFAAFTLVTWLPASNLIFIIGTILAERTLYLPLAGVAVVVASLLDDVRARARPVGAAAIAVALGAALVACGVRTWIRNEDWRDERRLWESARRAAPDSAKANAALAAALFVEGGADIDTIIALGERAIAIRPDYQNALVALGGHYVVRGDRLAGAQRSAEAAAAHSRALTVLERARELDTKGTDANLYNNLSLAYVRLGRLPEALAAYERSRDLDPLRARRHADVSAILGHVGRWEEAAVELFTATLLAPDDVELQRWLVELYSQHPGGGPPAVTSAPGGLGLDLDAPDVRRHHCLALARTADLYDSADRQAEAAAARAERSRRCPAPR